jgi:phosphoglycerate dehydrogenase-like enzyme
MTPRTILVICPPAAHYLRHLENLPDGLHIVAGDNLEAFAGDAVERAEVVLVAGPQGALLRALWPRLRALRWVHSLAAGLDTLLFDELIDSPVPLTNSRGVFARSLAEFAITGMLYFAKDLPRMLRSKGQGRWDPFLIEELHGRTLGIVGYGEIGRTTAALAMAFGMEIHGVRKRPELFAGDALVDRAFGGDELHEMLGTADYVLTSAPLTPETRGMIGAPEFAAMKRSAVLLNFGRGPVVSEPALIEALQTGSIRGAVLDVFEVEPLPPESPLWALPNVLISPHCADNTVTWMDDAMELFIDNFARYDAGEPLRNIAQKRSGY